MERQVCEFVLIDKCPECGGIWLDRGELEIIRDTIENDASRFHLGLANGLLLTKIYSPLRSSRLGSFFSQAA